MGKFIRNKIRKFLVGKDQNFTFASHKDEPMNFESFKNLEKTSLYIHIPFCKNMCPYCPYNRVLFQEDKLERYFLALHKEINMYREMIGPIKIESIYIGGGTPTSGIDYLGSLIDHIKEKFN